MAFCVMRIKEGRELLLMVSRGTSVGKLMDPSPE